MELISILVILCIFGVLDGLMMLFVSERPSHSLMAVGIIVMFGTLGYDIATDIKENHEQNQTNNCNEN